MGVLNFFASKDDNLLGLAQKEGFVYIDTNTYPDLVNFLKDSRKNLKQRTHRNFWEQYKLSKSIRQARLMGENSEETIAYSYDREYGGRDALYGYTSIVLSVEGFKLVTRRSNDSISHFQIIDVGAGSNEFLRFCQGELGIPAAQLYGSDISLASKRLIEADGFKGYVGRLEKLDLPQEFFDIVYLSYFIDYDTNQAATFSAAIDITKSGATIVLEGLFPVRPFALSEKDADSLPFVTKGQSVHEDIRLVMESFRVLGREKGKRVSLKQVVKTHRFVRSHYGFNRLPSYFLTFSVSE